MSHDAFSYRSFEGGRAPKQPDAASVGPLRFFQGILAAFDVVTFSAAGRILKDAADSTPGNPLVGITLEHIEHASFFGSLGLIGLGTIVGIKYEIGKIKKQQQYLNTLSKTFE